MNLEDHCQLHINYLTLHSRAVHRSISGHHCWHHTFHNMDSLVVCEFIHTIAHKCLLKTDVSKMLSRQHQINGAGWCVKYGFECKKPADIIPYLKTVVIFAMTYGLWITWSIWFFVKLIILSFLEEFSMLASCSKWNLLKLCSCPSTCETSYVRWWQFLKLMYYS